jgi:hypothetical protein
MSIVGGDNIICNRDDAYTCGEGNLGPADVG